MLNDTYYVSAGDSRHVEGAGVLRATVGPGLALLVTGQDYKFGGLLHMGEISPTQVLESDEALQQMQEQVRQFLTQTRDVNHQNTCNVDIVGGADALRTVSSHVRNAATMKQVDTINRMAEATDCKVGRVMVGGRQARSVRMDFNSAQTRIRLLGQKLQVEPEKNLDQVLGNSSPPLEDDGKSIMVETGKIVVSRSPDRLVSILGSCVAVALYDERAGIGGMVHVLNPDVPEKRRFGDDPGRYAPTALPALVAQMVKAGADETGLKARIAGGANLLRVGGDYFPFRIGARNSEILTQALMHREIPVLSEDLGGVAGRKMWVNLRTFEWRIKILGK